MKIEKDAKLEVKVKIDGIEHWMQWVDMTLFIYSSISFWTYIIERWV